MGFWDAAKGLIGGALFSKQGRDFLTGTPEVREQVSNLTPGQLGIQKQLQKAAKGSGAGGAFGDSADYYRNLISDDSADLEAFSAPELRRFNEQIVPDLAEQFAGMGAGNLSSSGFRNAAVGAGTDLSERLGAIRAQLRQQGAQGLQNIGSQSLTPHTQWQTTQQGTPGFLSQAAQAAGTAAGAAFGGPAGAQIGNMAGNMAGNWLSSSNKGSSSPYGNSGFQNGGLSSQGNAPRLY